MKFCRLSVFLLALSLCAANAQERVVNRKAVVQTFWTSGTAGTDVMAALAEILTPLQHDSGCYTVNQLLENPSTDIIDRYRFTAVYLHAGQLLPDSLRERIRSLWENTAVLPYESEHEQVIYYTALLLASDSFPLDQKWFNGKSSQENSSDALEFLQQWMQAVTQKGQQEFDSPTYGALIISAMVLLRDFSKSQQLREQAEVMIAWLLADAMHEYLEGQFGGAHARIELFTALQPMGSDMSALAWMYFGIGIEQYSREQFLISLSSYNPPKEIVSLATDRKSSYLAIEMKRSGTRIRGEKVATSDIMKYTFVTPKYVIGSMKGGLVQAREQQTWSLIFLAGNDQTTVFSMQPYSEPSGVIEFLPHEADLALKNIAKRDPYFRTPTKTVGGSPFEDIFQYKNTVVALYDVPDIQWFPYVIGFLPSNVKKFEYDSAKSGWMTMDAGEVFIAVHPLRPVRRIKEDAGQRLYSMGGKNGFIVQIVSKNEISSYTKFRSLIRKSKIVKPDFDRSSSVRYTTIFKDTLDCSFGKELVVNGSTLVIDSSKLFDSPFLQSERGSGVLTLTTKAGSLRLDFPARTMTSSP